MAKIKYYTFKKIKGDVQEQLLIQLQDLISSEKIKDKLPDDTKSEINEINKLLEDVYLDEETKDLVLSGGTY